MKKFLSTFTPFEVSASAGLAAIPGIAFGFFIHGYWLVDLFPVGSRRLLFVSGFLCMASVMGYALLFLWLKDRLRSLSWRQLVTLAGTSILLGVTLFLATTDNWQSPVRYVSLLLPNHTLEVSISPAQADGEIQVLWFETSLGDVSFNSLEYEGWKLENNRLVLKDYQNNLLRWSGKTGENAQMVFYSTSENGNATAAWDGRKDVFPLLDQNYTYYHSFEIPFYASKAWLLFLGMLNFTIVVFPPCLLVWEKRSEVLPTLQSAGFTAQLPFGWKDGLIVLLVIILAGLLRFPNLENLFPVIDEYRQFLAAKQIIQGAPLQDVYQRSLWLLTLPVSFAFRVFGYKIWIARSVGVVFNLLAIIPLYWLGRKINRPTAILAILLYATNPLIIALARVAREYAYYPFYFYWIVYCMVVVLEKTQAYVRGSGKRTALFILQLILPGLCLILPVIYALYVDVFATFKIILIAYLVFGAFIILSISRNIWWIGFAMVLATGAIVLIIRRSGLIPFPLILGFDPSPIYHFFSNPPQQWYFNRIAILPAIGFLTGIAASLLVRRQNFAPIFFTSLFAGFLAFFVFSPDRRFEARHINTANLWFIVLLAFGLHILWMFLQTYPILRRERIRYLTALVVVIISINSRQILLPMTSHDSHLPITGHRHPELGQLHEFLLANAGKDDVIISTNAYIWYADWMDEPKFPTIYFFGLTTDNETIQSIVDQHDSGWIVFDEVWISQLAFPPFQAFKQNSAIEYIGLFGDEHLWHWKKNK